MPTKDWQMQQAKVRNAAMGAYQWALDQGIAKEQARVVLPEGNTVSRVIINGTIRSYIHYIDVRTTEGTQKEHIELARAIGEAVTAIFPMTNEFIN